MWLRTSLPDRPCIVMAAVVSILVVAPASSADQGSVQIVAIAPAFCRVSAAAPTLAPPSRAVDPRACNTVNDAQITARVSNLDGAKLELDGADIAVAANGMATFSPLQLATLSELHVVGAGPVAARAPIAVELTVAPQ